MAAKIRKGDKVVVLTQSYWMGLVRQLTIR